MKGMGNPEIFPIEGGSGLPQSSRPSQVSPFVCDFENWAQAGRGPRCRMPEQFPTASYSVREAMVATEHFQHQCQEWGRHPEGEAHVGAPSMATAHTLPVCHLPGWALALHSGVTLFLSGMAPGLP